MTVDQGAQVSVANSIATERIFIGDDNTADGSRLTISGLDSRVDYNGTGDVSVGNAGGSTTNRATLEVNSGGVFSAVQLNPDMSVASEARIIIGDIDNGNGHVIVDGAGSLVEASVIYVGDGTNSSSGVLDIRNGGTATTIGEFQAGSNGNGVGTVNVDGATATLDVGTILSLGDDFPGNGTATGNLNVTEGGTVSNGGQAYIGHFTGSFGTATIGSTTANASSWTIGGELTLAGTETSSQGSGFGVLNINVGGLVDVASNLRIRNLGDVNLNGGEIAVGGDILFTDAGSTFNFNTGTLRFTDGAGATLDGPKLENVLGANPALGADQHLAVDGTAVLAAPLRLNGGMFSVGSITPASLANLDWDAGALNITAQTLTVGPGGLLGQSIVVDQNQTLSVPSGSNNITVEAGADLNVIRGSLTTARATNDGLIVVSNTTAVDFDVDNAGSGLTNNGDLVAIDSVIDGVIQNNGAIEVIGSVTFSDGVTLAASSSLGFDINGLLDFDTVSVGGDLALGGALDLDVEETSFSLMVGDSFEIIDVTGGSLSGTFAGLADGALVGNFSGVALFIDYGSTGVALFAVEFAPEDLHMDGFVDGLDLGILLGSWNQSTTPDLGELNGIPPVDGLDLGLFLGAWNPPPLSALTAVPEPTTAVLLAGVVAFSILTRCWCRRG